MASLSCRKSLMLVMVMVVIGGVQSGPRKIVRRQTPFDTSHLNDQDLVGCLTAQFEGRECDISSVNEIQVGPAEELPGCRCVPTDQCLDNKNPSKPITATTEFLINLVNVKSSCLDPFHICCTNIVEGPTPGPTAPNPIVGPTPGPTTPNPIVGPTPGPTTPNPIVGPTPGPTESYVPKCGQLKIMGVGVTMVGFQDNQAQFGQFPWMAAVRTTDGDNVCGASLIHPRVVLTAAHYVQKREAQQLTVRLGEWNFRLQTEPIAHQDIRVQRIVLHSDFSPNQLWYDVALLFLEENAILGPTVDTICLPSPFETFDGASCYSSGWGKDQFGQDGKYSEILKSLTLPAVNHQQCQNAFRSTSLGNTFNLHNTFMCAGGQGGVDTCTGDGGSPLVCPMKSDPSRYIQAGVVAWGIGCGTDGVPGAYASVSQAVDWIGQQLPTNLATILAFDVRTGNHEKR